MAGDTNSESGLGRWVSITLFFTIAERKSPHESEDLGQQRRQSKYLNVVLLLLKEPLVMDESFELLDTTRTASVRSSPVI